METADHQIVTPDVAKEIAQEVHQKVEEARLETQQMMQRLNAQDARTADKKN